MKVKNKILLSIMLILCFNLVHASYVEENTYMGLSVESELFDEDVNTINEEVLNYQTISAEQTDSQLGLLEVSIDEQKQEILGKTSRLWYLIGGLFVLWFDVLRMSFYFFSIWAMTFVIFKMFPMILIKYKEIITKWYLERIQ